MGGFEGGLEVEVGGGGGRGVISRSDLLGRGRGGVGGFVLGFVCGGGGGAWDFGVGWGFEGAAGGWEGARVGASRSSSSSSEVPCLVAVAFAVAFPGPCGCEAMGLW